MPSLRQNVLEFSMCPPIRGIVQAIQYCVMVAFLYLMSINAMQNQHYTMHNAKACMYQDAKLQSRDIIFRHFVTSPFKTVHFQVFCKNYYDEVNGCIFTNLHW